MKTADMETWLHRREIRLGKGYTITYLGWPDRSDIGRLLYSEFGFEAWEPDPKYPWAKRTKRPIADWPIIKPANGPPDEPDLPETIAKMVDATWKFAEPAPRVQRGNAGRSTAMPAPGAGPPAKAYRDMRIGTRGRSQEEFMLYVQPGKKGYAAQVRPTPKGVLDVHMGNETPIASDWEIFKQIKRTNAVTFRADKRPPFNVIVNERGFHPPNTRKDKYYTDIKIPYAFVDYIHKRYNRDFRKEDVLRVLNDDLRSIHDKELLNEYIVWLSIVRKESSHLARMMENEFMKGWTSTTPYLDTALTFATLNHTPGWIYVTIVHSAFIVPVAKYSDKVLWSSVEAEIAQYGSVPAERIVGFVHISTGPTGPDTPIFLHKSLRENDPSAFKAIHRALSGGCTGL